jgi:hypothetical protein
MTKQICSGTPFKNALEARLHKRSQDQGMSFSVLQLRFANERLRARFFRPDSLRSLFKGGFATDVWLRPELRVPAAVRSVRRTV